MADNNQNDEYQFSELDPMGNETFDDPEPGLHNTAETMPQPERKDIKRNAIIVVVLVVLAYLLYKILGSWFSAPTEPVKPAIAPIAQTTPQPIQAIQQPIEQPQQLVAQEDSDMKQKVSSIEVSQQSVKVQVDALGQKVTVVDTNLNNLTTQISQLNQLVQDLTNQVSKQSEEITLLTARAKQPKRVYHRPGVRVARIMYYIQAVIPGRAWLIGSNGSTLTVRAGTKIPGYGVVKLIDSLQGQILTSSGQVIRFSQEDS